MPTRLTYTLYCVTQDHVQFFIVRTWFYKLPVELEVEHCCCSPREILAGEGVSMNRHEMRHSAVHDRKVKSNLPAHRTPDRTSNTPNITYLVSMASFSYLSHFVSSFFTGNPWFRKCLTLYLTQVQQVRMRHQIQSAPNVEKIAKVKYTVFLFSRELLNLRPWKKFSFLWTNFCSFLQLYCKKKHFHSNFVVKMISFTDKTHPSPCGQLVTALLSRLQFQTNERSWLLLTSTGHDGFLMMTVILC